MKTVAWLMTDITTEGGLSFARRRLPRDDDIFPPNEWRTEELVLRTDAEAAIARALEEAARIADLAPQGAGVAIADRIRALKGKPCES